ncbi:orexigenic neuropeptide QRFP [Dromaius novaehollandiae]|uniref:orexigenic neuropeptide QRFP n=1 Tax=Dromaius novaehollandiae TaxID=8790 RepID=UPI00311FEB26
MRASYSLSCLVLLSLGSCFPAGEQQEPGDPREGARPGPSWRQAAAEDAGPGEELSMVLGAARLRFGRQERSGVPAAGDGKRSSTLGDLAEELSGYSRKKGGFTFRFGR